MHGFSHARPLARPAHPDVLLPARRTAGSSGGGAGWTPSSASLLSQLDQAVANDASDPSPPVARTGAPAVSALERSRGLLSNGARRVLIAGALIGSVIFLYTYVMTAQPVLAFVTGIILGPIVSKMFEHPLTKVSDYVRKVFSPQREVQADAASGTSALSRRKLAFFERTYDKTNAEVAQRISWMRELVGKLSLLTEHHVGRAAEALREGPSRLGEAAVALAVPVQHAVDYPDIALPEEERRRLLLPLRALPDETLGPLRTRVAEVLRAVSPAEDLQRALATSESWFATLAAMPRLEPAR